MGHKVDQWTIAHNPTCAEEGSETGYCSVCEKEVTQPIAKLDHTPGDWTIATEATYDSSGTKTQICTVCGQEISKKSYTLSEDERIAYYKKDCTPVSYDDLYRYPDTYQGKRISCTVYIKDVETLDSAIFEDQYVGTLNGNTISVFDGRNVKEPKLRAGDTVVIYGEGRGYNTQFSYQSGLLGLPKNVQTEKIPSITIIYVDIR